MSELTNYEALKNQVLALEKDAIAFEQKGNKSAGTRLRQGLQETKTLAQKIRQDVQAKKNAK